MRDPLFLIAILPDEHLQKEVTAFKNYCAKHFHASHSLTSPPHITLIPPFGWNTDSLSKISDSLSNFAANQTNFEVGLNGFNCFPPRVIYVDIEPNQQLSKLATDLTDHLEKQIGLHRESSHGFNPHMTIAHRDLQQQVFPKAWAYFSKMEFRRKFLANGLTLLRHEHGRWKVERTFTFV